MCAAFFQYFTTGRFGAAHIAFPGHWKDADEWKALVGRLSERPTPEAIQGEMGIGDDEVQVYAVGTPLSRYLYAMDDRIDDCVVHIIPPIEEAKHAAETIKQSLPKLKFAGKEKPFSVYTLYTFKDLNAVGDAQKKLFGQDFHTGGVWKDLPDFKADSYRLLYPYPEKVPPLRY